VRDWAKDAHRVCILEGDGEPLLQRGVTHDERDLDGMCELLVESEVICFLCTSSPPIMSIRGLLRLRLIRHY
jgi:hypothetical protein